MNCQFNGQFEIIKIFVYIHKILEEIYHLIDLFDIKFQQKYVFNPISFIISNSVAIEYLLLVILRDHKQKFRPKSNKIKQDFRIMKFYEIEISYHFDFELRGFIFLLGDHPRY